MMKYSAVTKVWYHAYWLVHRFLMGYLDSEQCGAAASRTCSLWFQNAADGVESSEGAYRALFAAAEYVMTHVDPGHLLGLSADMEASIPLDQGTLPYHMSSLYASIWQAAQLCQWDRATIHKIAKRISGLVPTDNDEWYETEPVPFDDPVARLARRAFDVMYEHDCVDNPICDQSGVIWEREDTRSQAWIETERLAREGI